MKRILNYFIGEITFQRNMIRNYRVTIGKQGKITNYVDFENLTAVINFLAKALAGKISRHTKRQIKQIYVKQILPNISEWREEDAAEVVTIKELQQKYSKKA